MPVQKNLLWTAAAVFLGLPLAVGADPWKDESGHGYKPPHAYGHQHREREGGPPPWAPAHGYRGKQGKGRGHDDEVYVTISREIGIPQGTCRREVIGSIVGGVIGGVIGARVGEHNDNEALGTVAGTVIGILVGREVGRSMDQADQQCTGQALERAAEGQTISWRNDQTGVRFQVTPTRTYRLGERHCRDYITRAEKGAASTELKGSACRNPDGSWSLAEAASL